MSLAAAGWNLPLAQRKYNALVMKLSRPQRVKLAWAMIIIGTGVFGWMIWGPKLLVMTSASSTIVRREYGIARWLTITTEYKGMLFTGPQAQIVKRDYDWHPRGTLINAIATLGITVVLALPCRRMVRKDRLVGNCDECGYDLTGLWSDVCPECGAKVDAAARGAASD